VNQVTHVIFIVIAGIFHVVVEKTLLQQLHAARHFKISKACPFHSFEYTENKKHNDEHMSSFTKGYRLSFFHNSFETSGWTDNSSTKVQYVTFTAALTSANIYTTSE
jgi:hypothetical protein